MIEKKFTPEALITAVWRLKPAQVKGLEKLGLATLADLLYHFPHRHEAPVLEKKVEELVAGEKAAVYGLVRSVKIGKAFRKKIPLAEVVIADATGEVKAIWFHQAYLARRAGVGQTVKLTGPVAKRGSELYFSNPSIENAADAALERASLFAEANEAERAVANLRAIYPETRGLSSTWLEYRSKQLLTSGLQEQLSDPLPEAILATYHLPALRTALVWIHAPRQASDATAARKRFAFEEVFFIQLARARDRSTYRKHQSYPIKVSHERLENFFARLPFAPTNAQRQVTENILTDCTRTEPMMRLLEGDVGSGKTLVAAAVADQVVAAGLNVAYMAPTEILARQHFRSFTQLFGPQGVTIGLLTGKECRKFPSKINPQEATHISRAQLLKWVANGEIPIVVGTQALIQKTVRFKKLALVIIDEQHRFGVEQRARLARAEERLPHLLSMTATPIPRTLALTTYGDLDLSLLDELPPGRKTIITEIVAEENRARTYEKIRQELGAGRQAYVICPRINEPDLTKELALEAKSARAEAKRLQEKVFPEFTVGLLHSKLKPAVKEEVMADFVAGRVQILVATSVVEVGINVPNATMIMIEGAERFGLAQLHQLRGRVARSSDQAYCFLLSEKQTGKALARLTALETAKSGFALAELDLKLRGAGALTSGKQWGLSDLGMEALQNLKMVEAAREEAKKIIATDSELKNYPVLASHLATNHKQIHFE